MAWFSLLSRAWQGLPWTYRLVYRIACFAPLKPAGKDVAVVSHGSDGLPVEIVAWG